MNKKLYPLLILALVLIPIAAASISGGIEATLGWIFDATDDLVYIKAVMWVVLFFVIFKSAEKIFPANRGAALMIAILVAVLGARFMPEEYLEVLGGGYAILIVIIILIGPFLLGNILGSLARFQRRGKTYLVILFYAAFAYALMRWEGYSPSTGGLKGEALSAWDVALEWVGEYKIVVWVLIGLICAYFIWGRGRGAPAMPAGTRGPGFFSGLGKGIGQRIARGKMAGGSRFKGWMARRQAAQAQKRKMITDQKWRAQAQKRKMIEDKKWRSQK